jgi:hypothetical protein
MLKHHQVQGVLCAALAAIGLLLTSCRTGAQPKTAVLHPYPELSNLMVSAKIARKGKAFDQAFAQRALLVGIEVAFIHLVEQIDNELLEQRRIAGLEPGHHLALQEAAQRRLVRCGKQSAGSATALARYRFGVTHHAAKF